jgi:MFS family permease
VISSLLGFVIGGIVPSYVILVSDHFPFRPIGARIGLMMLGVQLGLAIGSWTYGAVLDMTRSHPAAFFSSVTWALCHLAIIAAARIRWSGVSALWAANR